MYFLKLNKVTHAESVTFFANFYILAYVSFGVIELSKNWQIHLEIKTFYLIFTKFSSFYLSKSFWNTHFWQ